MYGAAEFIILLLFVLRSLGKLTVMCKLTIQDIPLIGSLNINEIDLENISDEDLQANEEMFESSEEDELMEEFFDTSICALFKIGYSKLTIQYNLNMYDDLIIEDIHMSAKYFEDIHHPETFKYCFSCASVKQDHIGYHYSTAHRLLTPDEFSKELIFDMNYNDCFDYFCACCQRFLYKCDTNIPECCRYIYDNDFVNQHNNYCYIDCNAGTYTFGSLTD